MAKHLPRFLPGNPTIIPQYMPGAGGIKASNYVYNVAVRNGSIMASLSDSLVITSVLRPERVKYDANKFTWIGAPVRMNNVLAMRSDSGLKNFDAITKNEAVLAATGLGSQATILPKMLAWLSPAKIKVVTGYKGSRGMLGAMERKEVQGMSLAWTSWKTLKGDWFKEGFAVPIVQFGLTSEMDLPNVPLAIDLARTADERAIVEFMSSTSQIGRSVLFPPTVPKDRITAVRTAFDKMVKDPAYVSDVTGRRAFLNPGSGAEIQKAVAKAMAFDPALAVKARRGIFGK
jgi:tripartite-type tricarboxylate transporter receptor subunit TctC